MNKELIIQFNNVGRSKFSGQINFVLTNVPEQGYVFSADDIAALAWKETRKHLISAGVECVYNEETNEGNVYAGGRTVGTFHVVTKDEGKIYSFIETLDRIPNGNR